MGFPSISPDLLIIEPSNVEALADAVASLKLDQPLEKTILDDGEQFYRKLESLSHLLGVLGHFLPKVELLDAMCKLCEATVLPNTADGELLRPAKCDRM